MDLMIVGLGPGAWGQVTLEVRDALEQASDIVLRAAHHPVAAHLPGRVRIQTFDEVYEQGSSSVVCQTIVDQVWALAQRPGGVVYAVPGHPLAGEATVRALLSRCREEGVPCRVLPGLSFIEPALIAAGVDPLEAGLQIVDALDPRIEPDRPALIAQVSGRRLASNLKAALLAVYPPQHPMVVIQNAGTAEERIGRVVLAALDDHRNWDQLTCLFVPAVVSDQNLATFEGVRGIVARLRAPDGCPWDREQTHTSLKPYVLEEAYEVLQALDDEDMPKLAEELGDLLMNLLMQAQIATEAGEFTINDVFRTLSEKLIRRHPHVFGTAQANSSEEVLANWEVLKSQERKSGESALAGISDAMPALAFSNTMLAKARRLGVSLRGVEAAGPAEDLRPLLEAQSPETRLHYLGAVLLGLVDLSRELDLDPEEALRLTNGRFRRRFQLLESAAAQQGRMIGEFSPNAVRAIWQSQA